MNNRIGETAILNGEPVPAEGLTQPPADAVLVYEVIRLLSGAPLFLEDHCARLNSSMALAGFDASLSAEALRESFASLVSTCGLTDVNIRVNAWLRNGMLVWTAQFVESHYPAPEAYQNGVDTGLLAWERTNPAAKVWQAGLKETAARICDERSLHEVILIDQQGKLSEGSRSNLFFTQGRKLVTAPDDVVLGGITRLKLLELIESRHLTLERREICTDELDAFDGAFLTGTSIHILPVRSIEVWRRSSSEQPLIVELMQAFRELVASQMPEAHKNR